MVKINSSSGDIGMSMIIWRSQACNYGKRSSNKYNRSFLLRNYICNEHKIYTYRFIILLYWQLSHKEICFFFGKTTCCTNEIILVLLHEYIINGHKLHPDWTTICGWHKVLFCIGFESTTLAQHMLTTMPSVQSFSSFSW